MTSRAGAEEVGCAFPLEGVRGCVGAAGLRPPVLSLRPRLALRANGSRQTRQTGASSCLAWACSQPSRNGVKKAPARGKPRHSQTTSVSHGWAVAEPRFELRARPWPPQSAGPLAAEAPSYAGSPPLLCSGCQITGSCTLRSL